MFLKYGKPVLILAILIGVGIWLLGFGWTRFTTDRLLDQNSAVAEGRVIDASTRALSKGGQFSTLVVEYVPANHGAITREFDVDGTTYRAGLATGKAAVSYLPEDPRISRVTRFASLPYQILIGMGGIMLFSGFFCLMKLMRTRQQAL